MTKSIARRRLLSYLPVFAFPFAIPKSAYAVEDQDTSLLINAADSLYHYKILLEQVRGDAYRLAALQTTHAVEACSAVLDQLRDAVTELRLHLHTQANWPVLQRRFTTLEHSLALMQGKRPDEPNPEALRTLPETTAALDTLMKDVSSACDADHDEHIAKLVDTVYTKLNEQNQSFEEVDTKRSKWSEWNEQIEALHDNCRTSMDDAAIAVVSGAENKTDWLKRASAALESAIKALNGITSINTSMVHDAAEDKRVLVETESVHSPDGKTAIEVLQVMLHTTLTSLTAASMTGVMRVAYAPSGAAGSDNLIPSVSLSKTDAGLIKRVQALVRQPKYFAPGSTTQTVNCIAVCWPVWLVYSSDNPTDVQQRTSLIASALYFNLIWGTIPETHGELTDQLQPLYLDTLKSRTA